MEPGEEEDEESGLKPPAESQSMLDRGSWDSGCDSVIREARVTIGEDRMTLMGVPRGGGGGAW